MEYFDITDHNGIPTGEIISRSKAHRLGIMHRTAHIWVIRNHENRTEVLLQKRSAEKDSFPLCLDTSSAGHIQAGDEPLPSALRELKEELGIEAEEEDLTFIGTFHIDYEEVFHDQMFRDHEIAFLYLYEKEVNLKDLKLQKEEVESAEWMDLEELEQRIQTKDPEICCEPDSVRMLREYIGKHRK